MPVTISETTKDKWLVVLTNNTTGRSYQETITYASSYSSAEWVVEAPSSSRSLLPLDFFQKNCGLLAKLSLKHAGVSVEK